VTISLVKFADYGLAEAELESLRIDGAMELLDEQGDPGLLVLMENGNEVAELAVQDGEVLILDWVLLLVTGILIAVFVQFLLQRKTQQKQQQVLAKLKAINNGEDGGDIVLAGTGLEADIVAELDHLCRRLDALGIERAQLLTAHQDLLHGVAHEFRSPMARLSFAIDMLPDTDNDGELTQLRQDIDDALEEMEHLVKEVLHYNRLQTGGRPLQYETVALMSLAQKLIAKQKPLTPDINFTLHGGEETLMADIHLLDRALTNLLRNAARFARQEVGIYWREEGRQLLLGVTDDGIGVPPGKRDSIFEPFTRLDASRSRDSGGVGLGLSIVKSICDRHGAVITVGSSSSGGAEFVMRYPLQPLNQDQQ
jgi:two-component system sensor histidine kinase RstB